MSVPAEYEEPVSLVRDVYAIIYDGWSPSELMSLDLGIDILAPNQAPLRVPGKSRLRLQSSMCLQPFEALQQFWDPHRMIPVKDRAKVLCHPNVQVIVHEGGNLGATSGGLLKSKFMDPMQFVFASSLDLMVVNSKQQQGEPFYRISVDCEGGRRYLLERTPSHVIALLQALRFSFPHLVVPFLTEVTVNAIHVVTEFLSQHADLFSTFVPVHYFLFEQNSKEFQAVFGGLPDMVRQRIAQEDATFAQTKPKVTKSWFGFGGSKQQTNPFGYSCDVEFSGPGMTLKEELDYIERDERIGKQLPDRFRVKYAFAASLQESISEAFEASRQLEAAVIEEGNALERLAECFTEVQATLVDDPLPGWGSDLPTAASPSSLAPEAAAASVSQPLSSSSSSPPRLASSISLLPCDTLTQVNKILRTFATVFCVLEVQVTVPMATIFRNTLGEAELHAMSSRQFLRSMILHAKFITEKEGIINGREDIRDSQAASNPAVMVLVKDLYAKRRSVFRNQKQTMNDELLRSSRQSKSALCRCCTVLLSLVYHWTDAFDARHYNELARRIPPALLGDQQQPVSPQQGPTCEQQPQQFSSPKTAALTVDAVHPLRLLLRDVSTASNFAGDE